MFVKDAFQSPKQGRVLELLAQGLDNEEIAKEMGLHVRTVKAHLNRMFVHHHIKGTGVKKVKLLLATLEPITEKTPIPANILLPKEWKILELIAAGYNNIELAPMANTTEYVVKNYCRNIFVKIGVWSRTEAAIWFLFHELVAPTPEHKILFQR